MKQTGGVKGERGGHNLKCFLKAKSFMSRVSVYVVLRIVRTDFLQEEKEIYTTGKG